MPKDRARNKPRYGTRTLTQTHLSTYNQFTRFYYASGLSQHLIFNSFIDIKSIHPFLLLQCTIPAPQLKLICGRKIIIIMLQVSLLRAELDEESIRGKGGSTSKHTIRSRDVSLPVSQREFNQSISSSTRYISISSSWKIMLLHLHRFFTFKHTWMELFDVILSDE